MVSDTIAYGRWFGRADVLRRVERASRFGSWSYEAYDCKLALETKATTILQLSLYSECLATIQGGWPEYMHVVPPSDGFVSFIAAYGQAKQRDEAVIDPLRQLTGKSVADAQVSGD